MLNLFFFWLIQTRRFNLNININYICRFPLSLSFFFHASFTEGVLHLTHSSVCCCSFVFFRGLALTCKALQNMQNDTNSEVHTCFKKSYDEVLGHHHSFIIRSVVSVSFCLFPWPPKKNHNFAYLLFLIDMLTCLLFFYFPNFICRLTIFLGFGSHLLNFFPGSRSYHIVPRLLNQPRATMTNCHTPAFSLTDTHKWMKKKHGNNNGHMKRIISISWWWRTLAFLLIPFVKTFFVRLLYYNNQVAILAVPRRNEFYMRIAQGGSIEKLDVELGKWLYGLESIVKHVTDFLERGGYGKV